MLKILRMFIIIFNFIILISSHSFGNEYKVASVDMGNIKNLFSSESIGDFFEYPHALKDYSLSGMSIVEFNVNKDGLINDIEILKSPRQPFDDVIFAGLNVFANQGMNQGEISKGFGYRLPIYFKN
tara:strand:- start:325 stop:702 length:378 start_codon:yes stop_codon:yes gene_type:complete